MLPPLTAPEPPPDRTQSPPAPTSRSQWLAAGGLLAVLAWVFLPTLLTLEKIWRTDPDEAHGYLVPLFVGYLLWTQRKKPVAENGPAAPLWGLLAIAVGLGLRFAGTYIYLDWLQAAAIVPCLLGIGMIVWGPQRAMARWAPLLFLLFMIPLPYRLATAMAYPLQRISALSSTYMLETIGYSSSCIGTTIHVGEQTLNVVAACSGMKILMTFFALSVAVALCTPRRPWWERLLTVMAAIPVALAANVIRIMTTAVFYQLGSPGIAQSLFHDLAGWLMMPVAMLLLALWTWLLRLCVEIDDEREHRRMVLPTSI
jgi:exosortase